MELLFIVFIDVDVVKKSVDVCLDWLGTVFAGKKRRRYFVTFAGIRIFNGVAVDATGTHQARGTRVTHGLNRTMRKHWIKVIVV